MADKFPYVIGIDPGHGGDDSGALGYDGTKEKNINLTIALLLEKKLLDRGFNVVMTRRNDSSVALRQRSDMLNANSCSVSVSVHNNSSGQIGSEANGTEVYMSIKRTENDIAFAKNVHGALVGHVNLRDNGILTRDNDTGTIYLVYPSDNVPAGDHVNYYHMIREMNMPAIIVEGGYLSNNAELAYMKLMTFQEGYAQGVYEGICYYFQVDPKIADNTLIYRIIVNGKQEVALSDRDKAIEYAKNKLNSLQDGTVEVDGSDGKVYFKQSKQTPVITPMPIPQEPGAIIKLVISLLEALLKLLSKK